MDCCTIQCGKIAKWVVCEVSGRNLAICFRVAKLWARVDQRLRRNHSPPPWRRIFPDGGSSSNCRGTGVRRYAISLASSDVSLHFAENEQLQTLTEHLQQSLVLVHGNFAYTLAENTELTRNVDQQFSLLSGKLEWLKAENANLKCQIA